MFIQINNSIRISLRNVKFTINQISYALQNKIIFLIDCKRDEDRLLDIEMNSMGIPNKPSQEAFTDCELICPEDES